MRIYELAKEMGISSKELIELLEKELGMQVSSLNTISDVEADKIKKIVINKDSKNIKLNDRKVADEKIDIEEEVEKEIKSNNKQEINDKTQNLDGKSNMEDKPQKLDGESDREDRPQRLDGKPNKGDRPQRPDGKPDRGDRPQRPDGKPDRGDRPQRPDGRPDRGDRPQRPDGRPDRGDRPQRPDGRPDRGDRPQRPDGRPDRGDRPQRPDGRPDRGDRPQRPDGRPDRGDRPQRPDGRPDRGDRPQRPDGRPDRGDRPQRPDGRPDRGDRPQRPDGRPDRGDRPQRPDGRPDRGDRPQRPDNRMDKDDRPQRQDSRQNRGDRQFKNDADLGLEVLDKSEARGSRNFNKDNKKDNKKNENIQKKGEFKQGKKRILNDIDDDFEIKGSKSKGLKNGKLGKKDTKSEEKQQPKIKNIEMEDSIVVRDLADKMGISVNQIISKLILLGMMVTMNQEIDFDTASLIAEEFNAKIIKKVVVDELKEIEEKLNQDIEDSIESLQERPPIVTVMGHVDHGKTSLLDAIRNTIEVSKEAGGITQHIGASIVEINGKKITFLDTPGHEAFTSMRARGASITDIAILVVAADDGVKPQTIEAINHAKAANVPIIVAVNKMDKNTANLDKVKQELSEHGVLSEEWGGDTIFVPVSAKQQQGIEDLLEMILLVAEMQELKANPNRNARGTIIEAKLDKGRGPVATVLVQKGTLNKGDNVLVGSSYGKIRAMFSSLGKKINQAGPSIPVEILGLSETPLAGDVLIVMDSDKDVKSIAEMRRDRQRSESMVSSYKVSLDDLYDRIQMGEVKDLNIILKADVRGSIEAIKQAFEKLSIKEVKVKIIHNGVGGINESDINLASASNALVIGFNVRPSIQAIELAKRENVDIRTYNIIYNAIEDLKQAINGMLDPEYKEIVQGRAEIRATFKVPNIGIVAGVYVLNGKITRKSKIRLLREDIVIHEGDIMSLKRFKDDASELNTGFEGGVGIEKFSDIKEGDIIEAYILEEIKRQ